MSNLWERFENIVSKDEVQVAKHKFEPLAIGQYDVVLETLEPSESKNGLPMLKGTFRTTEGNRVIFYNQVLQNPNYPNMTAMNIAEAVSFVGALLGEDIEFEGLGDFANTVETVEIGGQYKLDVTYGNKDFDMKFPKLKVVAKRDDSYVPPVDDGDVPF